MVVEPSNIVWRVTFLIKEEKKRRRDYSQKSNKRQPEQKLEVELIKLQMRLHMPHRVHNILPRIKKHQDLRRWCQTQHCVDEINSLYRNVDKCINSLYLPKLSSSPVLRSKRKLLQREKPSQLRRQPPCRVQVIRNRTWSTPDRLLNG
jgi:hypothetical protein